MLNKILVACKPVIDYAVKVKISPGGKSIQKRGVKHIINPFDEIAIEEAVKMKEKGLVKNITAVACGHNNAQEFLRKAMAMGVDQSVLIKLDESEDSLQPPIPFEVAQMFSKIISKHKPDLMIMGKQAIDDDSNQTSQILAGMLGWPQGLFASKITLNEDFKTVEVDKEVDGGIETVRLTLPAIISTDLRLNIPRYPSLPNIIKAKSKPLEIININDIKSGSESSLEHQTSVEFSEPEPRKAGRMVKSIEEFFEELKKAGFV